MPANPRSMLERVRKEESGVALAVVVMGVVAIALVTILLQRIATTQMNQSNFIAGEDAVLAAGEAMLERYAAKLTIEPLYYQLQVDEAEAPRRCDDPRSASFDVVVNPGSSWPANCATWTYEPTSDFYQHPLLLGESPDFDDVEVLMHVEPPQGVERLEVEIVARQAERPAQRVLKVEIGPDAASEFLWLVEGDMFFGPLDETHGKIYSGGIVGYEAGGAAYDDIYANVIARNHKVKNKRYYPPTWMNGAQGWDSTGSFNSAGEVITDVYPDPLDLDRFWDDLDAAAWAACNGGGICLDPAANPAIPANTTAYLVETTGTGDTLRISYATASPIDSSCHTSTHEARWTVASQNAAWTVLGEFSIPRNGMLWAHQQVVVAKNSSEPFALSGALTIYAGDSAARENIIIGGDTLYVNGASGNDMLALIASDEIWLNPNAVGPDGELSISASLVSQNGVIQVATKCLDNGSCRTDPGVRLYTYGSNTARAMGNLNQCFEATYDYDPRLANLRPPFFPLLNDQWRFSNWREVTEPCWATPAGCP